MCKFDMSRLLWSGVVDSGHSIKCWLKQNCPIYNILCLCIYLQNIKFYEQIFKSFIVRYERGNKKVAQDT